MYMIMFVLNDPKQTDRILEAWDKAGVRGATLLESTGAFRRRMRIPGRFAFTTTNKDETNLTMMAIVEEEKTIQKCLAATEGILGDLSKPHTGIFSYWQLDGVKGFTKDYKTD